HAYELLQALDVISLALSLLDPTRVTDPGVEPVPLPATLSAIEQPLGGRLLPAAPTAPLGEHVDLTLLVVAPGVATIDPWPFGRAEIGLTLPARVLPGEGLPETAGVEAYRQAPPSPIAWTLTAG
ncbi:MAG TPA: hypothetical protein VF731_02330, partial [Solirubrobacterales bacterium]